MMQQYNVIFYPLANKQLRDIIAYYNSLQLGLGKRFRNELNSELKSVRHHPYSRAIRYREIRFAVLDKFPYAAHYKIVGNTIIVQAVLSMHQDPETTGCTTDDFSY